MKERILQRVKEFLGKHFQAGRPLLVGYSGGPDSTALVHLLQDCDLHLCHIDHGWREESARETEGLRAQTKFPFHTFRLEGVKTEEGARQARLKIFHRLYHELDCQALVLGHQGDDQSETVLKRILEGAHLTSLGGILPVSQWEGMPVWRPLLQVSKKEILAWLNKKNISYLEDSTNHDLAFLRARMRQNIFPWLEKEFGKEIAGNLRYLGDTAQELKKYLEAKIQPFQKALVQAEGEVAIDLSPFFPWEPIELKSFLKSWLPLSRAELETLYQLLSQDASRSKVGERITVHRRKIAFKENF